MVSPLWECRVPSAVAAVDMCESSSVQQYSEEYQDAEEQLLIHECTLLSLGIICMAIITGALVFQIATRMSADWKRVYCVVYLLARYVTARPMALLQHVRFLVVTCLALSISLAEEVYREDPLALLSGTLRTYQRAGCDDQVVTLKCPQGTSISVQVAQYGKSAPSKSLCPQPSGRQVPPSVDMGPNSTCLWPQALQTVVEACQKKRQCKFQTSPKTFGGDPCPGVRKYVEVAYKCRPYEFRSKVACEDDTVQLKCNPNARIAVYSASFGRTEYESIQCPQPQGVPEETCLVSYATETVMQICHGKRRCALTAGAQTFGNPCRPESRMYLKVVYTCVPRKVLREHLVEGRGEDEDDVTDDDDEDFDPDDPSGFSPSPNVVGGHPRGDSGNLTREPPHRTTPRPPPHAKVTGGGSDVGKFGPHSTSRFPYNHIPSAYPVDPATTKEMQGDDVSDEKVVDNSTNCTTTTTTTTTTTIYSTENTHVIGFISEWINAYNFISQNQEKFYLYLILSVAAGLVLFLGLVIGRLLVQRHRARRDTKFHAPVPPEQTLPNGFADDASEAEADIDLTTPVPVVAVHSPSASISEVVRFGTVRRGPPEDAPRSLNRGGNSQYYYG
ncbi:uncharacterized protein [Anabrus simplex]|uniref:uncharacterized protein n=1 Tax=Anabrus simplex TaxID=316456 RepID=UPI0035A370B8